MYTLYIHGTGTSHLKRLILVAVIIQYILPKIIFTSNFAKFRSSKTLISVVETFWKLAQGSDIALCNITKRFDNWASSWQKKFRGIWVLRYVSDWRCYSPSSLDVAYPIFMDHSRQHHQQPVVPNNGMHIDIEHPFSGSQWRIRASESLWYSGHLVLRLKIRCLQCLGFHIWWLLAHPHLRPCDLHSIRQAGGSSFF